MSVTVNSTAEANYFYDSVTVPGTSWGSVAANKGDVIPSSGVAQVMDGQTTKYWASMSSPKPAMTVTLNTASVVSMIGLMSGNDHAWRDPKTIEIEASNNNSSWTTIEDSISVPVWSDPVSSNANRQEWRFVQFSNTNSYKYYRIGINSTGGSEFQLTEMQLYQRNNKTMSQYLDDQRVSEHSTTLDLGEIAMSQVNAATRHYINATQDGRSGTGVTGFSSGAENGLKNLHEWVGGMYYSNDAVSDVTNSLTTGPHAYTRFPGWKGHLSSQNTLSPQDDISLGAMRQHTPITIGLRTSPINKDAGGTDYYDGTDGRIAMRAYGVNGLEQVFSVNIAGETKTWGAGEDVPNGWWTGLGSGDGSAKWHGYRCKVGWTYDGVHGQEIANIGVGVGYNDGGGTIHGRYGWGPVVQPSGAKNYVAKHFGIWTTRDSFTSNSKASRFSSGGSQPPDATSAGQQEFFYDWFYAPTRNIRVELSGDDQINAWIRDCNNTQVWRYGDNDDFAHGGGWANDNPQGYNLTLPSTGWYQVIAGAKESPGSTPAYIGMVIWDRDAHGSTGPDNVRAAKNDEINGYNVEHSDGFIWTTRLSSGYRTVSNDVIFGQAMYLPNATTVGAYSDRVWWLPQQNTVLTDNASPYHVMSDGTVMTGAQHGSGSTTHSSADGSAYGATGY